MELHSSDATFSQIQKGSKYCTYGRSISIFGILCLKMEKESRCLCQQYRCFLFDFGQMFEMRYNCKSFNPLTGGSTRIAEKKFLNYHRKNRKELVMHFSNLISKRKSNEQGCQNFKFSRKIYESFLYKCKQLLKYFKNIILRKIQSKNYIFLLTLLENMSVLYICFFYVSNLFFRIYFLYVTLFQKQT